MQIRIIFIDDETKQILDERDYVNYSPLIEIGEFIRISSEITGLYEVISVFKEFIEVIPSNAYIHDDLDVFRRDEITYFLRKA